jgi:hypothetical protein
VPFPNGGYVGPEYIIGGFVVALIVIGLLVWWAWP